MYIVKTHPDGTVEWEKTFGGTGSDVACDVIETSDGYIAAGYTNSPSISVSTGGDLMVVKIKKESTPVPPSAIVRVSPPPMAVPCFVLSNPTGVRARIFSFNTPKNQVRNL